MQVQKLIVSLFAAYALFISEAKAQVVTSDILAKYTGWPRFREISQFYQLNQLRYAWIGDTQRQKDLLSLVSLASSIGLNEEDYQGLFFSRYRTGKTLATAGDSIDADVRFTDAAIHLFSEIKGGSKQPSFSYNGLRYSPDLSLVVPELKKHLDAARLKDLFIALQPRSKEYAVALGKLRWFQLMAKRNDLGEPRITSTVADSTNQPLLVRLYQLGITDSINPAISKKSLQAYIRAAQQQFDLSVDGVVGKATMQAMNTSLHHRIAEMKEYLNTLRWLEDIMQSGTALILNIPSANFLVYEKGAVVMESKVIAGKPSTPTPTLASTITEVILYPYWNVTHNIATKEMLPRIKRDIGYLERGNYQVLNKQGQVLNPYSINWRTLSRNYFPYLIRQSTGCDNALGIVKFNFYNPFTVYLHDTPTKPLFSSNRRFFSHGCMRVEKPVELAQYLLGFNRIAIDTLTAKGCLTSQSPKTIKVEKPLPVIILYNTVWYNREGDIRFYEDVYKRQDWIEPKHVAELLQHDDNMLPLSTTPSLHH